MKKLRDFCFNCLIESVFFTENDSILPSNSNETLAEIEPLINFTNKEYFTSHFYQKPSPPMEKLDVSTPIDKEMPKTSTKIFFFNYLFLII